MEYFAKLMEYFQKIMTFRKTVGSDIPHPKITC